MLFTFFLAFVSSEEFLHTLTSSTFKKLVDGRKKNDVWFVMFSGPDCPACKQAKPIFRNASKVSGGMVKFGYIDANRAPDLSQKYDIRAIPYFRIFYNNGETEYNGDRKVKSFLSASANYLQDFSIKIDENWKETCLMKPGAILFTDKEKTPPLWRGISSYFYGKSIRVGISKSDQKMNDFFGIEKVPEVLFLNGTHDKHIKITSHVNFTSLRLQIEEFFGKRLSNDSGATEDDENKEFTTPDRFNDVCLGGRQNCILVVAKKPTEKLTKIIKMNQRHKFKWFVGDRNLPYPFMGKGGVWVYNPRRDGFIHVESVQELPATIDHVLDGAARWTKRSVFMEETKDL
ncbi:Thioredoxin family protein [Tritrichomonas foetus]|uniref:Thioredoxin family protein n=1 Tax=Tritrichomonas foetus TaxID=1144522 RepID=A0A1J4JCR7_9EUKA|nr:Thioredoxin family protein [Tritrichomonas foetus]|eukprot:OHS96888.1 Thioredoxin family protein [Tritrichomonas foetus]